MPLKYSINDPVEVPGPLRDYYKRTDDGRYALSLDGEPPGYVKAAKLSEFRENNRGLNAKVADLESQLKRYEGIDPDEVAALKANAVDPKAVAAATETLKAELAAQHAAEVERVRAEQTQQAADLETALAAEKAAHAATQFKNTIGYEFLRTGGEPKALDFIVGQAASVFTMKDGKMTSSAFSTEKPGERLTVAEWMGRQMAEAAFAFKPSRGGGATGGRPPEKRTVSSRDPLEFGKHLVAIANGDVTVS